MKTKFENYSEFMYSKLEAHTAKDSNETKRIKYALMKRLLIAETIESGCASMNEVSLNEYGSYERPIGPDYEFPGGFGNMINFFADKLPEDAIKTSHPVRHITFADREPNSTTTAMLVECFNGVKYKAQHVVVTTSSSYLKHNYMSLFNPALLNEQKILSINSICMNTVDKIFLFYDDLDFFPPQVETLHPIFLEAESEFGHRIEKNWHTKLSSINRFYDNVLMVWITGNEAHYIENLDDTEIAITLTNCFRRLLANKDVPMPNKIIK